MQDELVEDAIRRRQTAMHTADQHSAIHNLRRVKQREHETRAAVMILALRLAKPTNFGDLRNVLEALINEVADARDAVEHERAMRRL